MVDHDIFYLTGEGPGLYVETLVKLNFDGTSDQQIQFIATYLAGNIYPIIVGRNLYYKYKNSIDERICDLDQNSDNQTTMVFLDKNIEKTTKKEKQFFTV